MTMPTRAHVVAIALSLAVGSIGAACLTHSSANDPTVRSTQMPDGKQWTTANLNVVTDGSYFGKGGSSLNRHRDGNKQMAHSVRCVRE